MKISLQLSFCLIATISLGTALAQTSTSQTSESAAANGAPVAYVYVSRPTHVDGFAASSSGKLTPVPGSPFSNIALSHMSVTKKFLFGASDDQADIYTYSIASNGALKQVSEIDAHKYNPPDNDCFNVGPTQLDATGTTLYNDDWNCDGDSQFLQSYKIEGNGDLQFLANSGGASEDYTMSPPVVLGTDTYAYVIGIYGQGNAGGLIQEYKRKSNGALELENNLYEFPKPKNPEDVYTPSAVLASDSTDHLAIAIQAQNDISRDADGPIVLASYKADSNGNLTTTSTYENMPTVGIYPQTMSISPSGKLLAVGGGVAGCSNCGVAGFQIFRFNGSSPITHYTGVLHSSEKFVQFGWDSDNHLYALSSSNLHVYEATSTEIKEVSGSPYSIPEASSVIVLSLK
jgi:hypothetical protein